MVLALGAALLLSGGVTAAHGQEAGAAADTTSWTTKAIPKTHLTVQYPSSWRVFKPRSITGQAVVLKVGDPKSDGDNLVVIIYTGKDAFWYHDLAEYQAVAEASAEFSDGEVVGSASPGRVGTMPSYRHIESYMLHKLPVLFGNLEILQAKGIVVTFSVTVDSNEMDLVEGIINSVKATV